MDLTALLQKAREALTPGSTAVWTDATHSYGPAQSRITRAPIRFRTDLPQEASGVYADGTVNVDPTTWDAKANYNGNVHDIIKHEITHSALKDIPNDKLMGISATNPYYTKILSAMQGSRGGYMPAEIPAYMSESDSAKWNVPTSLQELYQQSFAKQLQSVNPDAAAKYSRMVGRR